MEKTREKIPMPQKKLIVHPQLIPINISASLVSSPQEAVPLIGLESHNSQMYKHNYYYHTTHIKYAHIHCCLHVIYRYNHENSSKHEEMFTQWRMIVKCPFSLSKRSLLLVHFLLYWLDMLRLASNQSTQILLSVAQNSSSLLVCWPTLITSRSDNTLAVAPPLLRCV